jgi:hypothetical protein
VRPSHRLDLVLVPTAIDAPIARADQLVDRLRGEGVIGVRSEPGPRAEFWATSFASVRIEDPGRIVLWANRQGGFRVACPATGDLIGSAFEAALTAWRTTGGSPDEATFRCPSCREAHALPAVTAAPSIAFGPWGIVTASIGDPELAPSAWAWVAETVGEVTAVLRRGG